MALTIIIVASLTVMQSWKQGNFIATFLSVSFIFLGLSALIEKITGQMNISVAVFMMAVITFLFAVFVIAPMALRRARKKRT